MIWHTTLRQMFYDEREIMCWEQQGKSYVRVQMSFRKHLKTYAEWQREEVEGDKEEFIRGPVSHCSCQGDNANSVFECKCYRLICMVPGLWHFLSELHFSKFPDSVDIPSPVSTQRVGKTVTEKEPIESSKRDTQGHKQCSWRCTNFLGFFSQGFWELLLVGW